MAERTLDDILGGAGDPDALWEVFHENSKNWRASLALSELSPDETQARMRDFHPTLPYPGYPTALLPDPAPLAMPLGDAISARCSTRHFGAGGLTLPQLAALLHAAYGMIRDNTFVPYPPRTRAVPSAGALYPLEIYLHGARIEGLAPGLYHYDPSRGALHVLDERDRSRELAAATLFPDHVAGAAVVIFVTAIFQRATWKYGDRAYRYTLLECGHLAQNVGLAAAALDLAAFPLGGFFDREIDDLLGLDGVGHATLYMVCVGAR